MGLKKFIGVVTIATLVLGGGAACSSDSSNSADNYVVVWGSEPQKPLVPADTGESGGSRIASMLYSNLVYYDLEGKPHNEDAESINLEGDRTYRITLKDGLTFSDGSPLKAENYVDAWNYNVENDLRNSSFFEPIKGYESGKKLEGLKVVDDKTFTVELTEPASDFPLRLGYTAYAPLHSSAREDIAAFGEKPISSGPYTLAEWNHNESAIVVPNEHYKGDRKAQNDGIKYVFYPNPDAAYSDLLAGNLDVLDALPDSAFSTYEQELGDRAINQPSAVVQAFTIPEKLEHFGGEEGKLRRQAISMAINREEITEKIFSGTRTPAKDFSSPVLNGYNPNIPGNEVLQYNPEKAKELWAQADAMSPFTGEFAIAYNSDGGHKSWADAVSNSIKNVLGIEAVGKPFPDFKSLRDEITGHTINSAFRSGWSADYPSIGNFLIPNYTTSGSSNDGDYSNPEFDAKMKEATAASTEEEANKIYNEAQEILFQDLPAIPKWYSNVTGGYSENVENVKFAWDSIPQYYMVTKK